MKLFVRTFVHVKTQREMPLEYSQRPTVAGSKTKEKKFEKLGKKASLILRSSHR